jgi:hypothetical protein
LFPESVSGMTYCDFLNPSEEKTIVSFFCATNEKYPDMSAKVPLPEFLIMTFVKAIGFKLSTPTTMPENWIISLSWEKEYVKYKAKIRRVKVCLISVFIVVRFDSKVGKISLRQVEIILYI